MLVRRLVTAAVLSASVAWGAGGTAGAAEGGQCDLGTKYQVTSVAPYRVEQNYGYTSITQFRGAEVYVPAQPGLTREWLARTIADQVFVGTCDFGVPKVSVEVLSSGGGFRVRLTSADERAAHQIYDRAQQQLGK